MPCPDPHAEQDRLDANRRSHAMTALLCGVMRRDQIPEAVTLAEEWCHTHRMIDNLIEGGANAWAETVCAWRDKGNEILDRAYIALCGE